MLKSKRQIGNIFCGTLVVLNPRAYCKIKELKAGSSGYFSLVQCTGYGIEGTIIFQFALVYF
jgi:hypothetical protein